MKMYQFLFMLSLVFTSATMKAQGINYREVIKSSKAVEGQGQKDAIAFLNTLKKSPQNECGDSAMKKCNLSNSGISQHIKRGQACRVGPDAANPEEYREEQHSFTPRHELLIFVSFSLGSATLKKLYQDAQKIGGRLILRGLYKDSLWRTQQKIKALRIGIDIDPPLFDKFNIQEVPTFILSEPYQEEQPFKYDILKGNVTLQYALERFVETGSVFGAQILLNKIKGGSHA